MAAKPQPRLASPSHAAPTAASAAPRATDRFMIPRESSAPLVLAIKKQNSSRPPRASPMLQRRSRSGNRAPGSATLTPVMENPRYSPILNPDPYAALATRIDSLPCYVFNIASARGYMRAHRSLHEVTCGIAAQRCAERSQERRLGCKDSFAGVVDREPLAAIDLRNFNHAFGTRRPLDLAADTAQLVRIAIALKGPRLHQLAAQLANRAERKEFPVGDETGLFLKFALCGIERLFVVKELAFRNRPSALVFGLPEWTPRVGEENLDAAVTNPVHQQSRAAFWHLFRKLRRVYSSCGTIPAAVPNRISSNASAFCGSSGPMYMVRIPRWFAMCTKSAAG